MKIVQTNKAYFPKVGGIETTVTTLSEGLVNDYNCDVKVLTCNHNVSFSKKFQIIDGVEINYLPSFGFLHSLPLSPSYVFELLNFSGDILHIHEPFPLADLSVLLSKRIRNNFNKIIVSWHSDIIRQKWSLVFYRKYILNFLDIVDKIIVSNPALITNSEFLVNFKDKCTVIPIGVDLQWAENIEGDNFIKKDSPLILSVGRLVYYKGFEFLISAMKDVSAAKLIIVGSGPLERKIKRLIKNLNLEKKITIIPEVDRRTLNSLFKQCDLFVLPSIEKSETFGIVQIEAMACAKPVVCTDIGTGTTFINVNNLTGLVVPPKDSTALASAINKILLDDNLRINFGKNAKKRAFNEFNKSLMVKRVYELYQNCLG